VSDGSPERILLDQADFTYSDLSLSPDSEYLMYSRYSNRNAGSPEIWLVDIPTGQQTKVVSKGKQAVWLP
jgi:Tol biopolymer transport system component